jgi:hypothetical protein
MRRPITASDGARLTLAVLILTAVACTSGLGQLQTARTLPPGEVRQSISAGLDWNFMMETRGPLPGNAVLQYGARFGVSDSVDMGVKLFFGLGALVDAKVQVIHRQRLAVSVLGGAGAAYDVSSGGKVVHAPALLLTSYSLADVFTPYLGVGYGAFWIFSYGSGGNVPPGSIFAPRAWHGDGLMMLHAGFELGSRRRVLLEYGYLRPIADDAGDHYDFAVNHMILGSFQF